MYETPNGEHNNHVIRYAVERFYYHHIILQKDTHRLQYITLLIASVYRYVLFSFNNENLISRYCTVVHFFHSTYKSLCFDEIEKSPIKCYIIILETRRTTDHHSCSYIGPFKLKFDIFRKRSNIVIGKRCAVSSEQKTITIRMNITFLDRFIGSRRYRSFEMRSRELVETREKKLW